MLDAIISWLRPSKRRRTTDSEAQTMPVKESEPDSVEVAEAAPSPRSAVCALASVDYRESIRSLSDETTFLFQPWVPDMSLHRLPPPPEPVVEEVSPLDNLPDELLRRIIVACGAEAAFEQLKLGAVCRRVRRILFSVEWPVIDLTVDMLGEERLTVAEAAKLLPRPEGAPLSSKGGRVLLKRWNERIQARKVAGAVKLEITLKTPEDLEQAFEDLPDATQNAMVSELSDGIAGCSAELASLLAAAAERFSRAGSLQTVSLCVAGRTSKALLEMAMHHGAPHLEHILEDAAVALIPCASLRELTLDSYSCCQPSLPFYPAALEPHILASALGPHASSLRVLRFPFSSTLDAPHVAALVASLPHIETLAVSLKAQDAATCFASLSTLNALAEIWVRTPAPPETLAAGLTALSRGPAAASLRRLVLGGSQQVYANGLAAVSTLSGLTKLSLGMDSRSAPGVHLLAQLTALRELYVKIRLDGHDEGNELCRALAPVMRRLLHKGTGRAPRTPSLDSIGLYVVPQIDEAEGDASLPTDARAFDSSAFADLLAASAPALTSVNYEVYVRAPPTREELQALASCSKLATLTFRHRITSTADLAPYSLLVPGGDPARAQPLRRGVKPSVYLGVPATGRNLGERCLWLLDSWLPGSYVSYITYEPE
eukprot:tig00000989_g6121.t1